MGHGHPVSLMAGECKHHNLGPTQTLYPYIMLAHNNSKNEGDRAGEAPDGVSWPESMIHSPHAKWIISF